MTQWDGNIDIHDTEWFETHEEIPRAAAAAPLSMTHFTTVAIFAASWVHQLIYGASTVKQPCDWDALRKFFAWKPADVIRKTFAATTQYANNVVRLPMRAHFMPRFPALNVRRLQEVFATDTFFSSVPAHDGTIMCQLFVGRKSFFTDVDPMRDKAPFPRALLDFVRKHGAMQ